MWLKIYLLCRYIFFNIFLLIPYKISHVPTIIVVMPYNNLIEYWNILMFIRHLDYWKLEK